jgi:hypothetical protein
MSKLLSAKLGTCYNKTQLRMEADITDSRDKLTNVRLNSYRVCYTMKMSQFYQYGI